MLAAKHYAFYMTTMFGMNNYLPKVIAITGAKNSGKNTLANYIADRYKYEKISIPTLHQINGQFQTTPIKHPVKYMMSQMNEKKYYVINNMMYYEEYQDIAKLHPLVVRIDRPMLQEYECDYKKIPFHLNIINDKDVHAIAQKFESSFQ